MHGFVIAAAILVLIIIVGVVVFVITRLPPPSRGCRVFDDPSYAPRSNPTTADSSKIPLTTTLIDFLNTVLQLEAVQTARFEAVTPDDSTLNAIVIAEEVSMGFLRLQINNLTGLGRNFRFLHVYQLQDLTTNLSDTVHTAEAIVTFTTNLEVNAQVNRTPFVIGATPVCGDLHLRFQYRCGDLQSTQILSLEIDRVRVLDFHPTINNPWIWIAVDIGALGFNYTEILEAILERVFTGKLAVLNLINTNIAKILPLTLPFVGCLEIPYTLAFPDQPLRGNFSGLRNYSFRPETLIGNVGLEMCVEQCRQRRCTMFSMDTGCVLGFGTELYPSDGTTVYQPFTIDEVKVGDRIIRYRNDEVFTARVMTPKQPPTALDRCVQDPGCQWFDVVGDTYAIYGSDPPFFGSTQYLPGGRIGELFFDTL